MNYDELDDILAEANGTETVTVAVEDYGIGKVVRLDDEVLASILYLGGETSIVLYSPEGETRLGLRFQDDEVAAEYLASIIAGILADDEEEAEVFAMAASALGESGEQFV